MRRAPGEWQLNQRSGRWVVLLPLANLKRLHIGFYVCKQNTMHPLPEKPWTPQSSAVLWRHRGLPKENAAELGPVSVGSCLPGWWHWGSAAAVWGQLEIWLPVTIANTQMTGLLTADWEPERIYTIFPVTKKLTLCWAWWHMPLIPAVQGQELKVQGWAGGFIRTCLEIEK